MKKQEKRMILILLAVLAIVIIALVINKNAKKENKENKAETANNTVTEEFVQVLEDGTKLNTSEQLNKTSRSIQIRKHAINRTRKPNSTISRCNKYKFKCNKYAIIRCNTTRQKRKRNSNNRRNNLTITTRSKNTIQYKHDIRLCKHL